LLVLEDAKLGRPVGERQAQAFHVRMPCQQHGFDLRDFPAATLDSCGLLPALLSKFIERAAVAIERRFLA
jgi:hypothetical protein